MKASINNYRQAPRKVRLITDLVKGKSVVQAQGILTHLIKRGSLPVKKLLDSAVANSGSPASDLMIKKATVDKGLVIKRWMPRAMGRAFPIHKHTSHIVIELAQVKGEKTEVKSKAVKAKSPKVVEIGESKKLTAKS